MKANLETFYLDNKDLPEKNYPGLNQYILTKEFEECLDEGIKPGIFKSLIHLGIPFPYFKNRTYFYKSSFLLNSACFIPRFETELMVDMALSIIKDAGKVVRVADVCSGIGAIILSVMQNSDKVVEGIAIDIDATAVHYANLNYYNLEFRINPESTFKVIQADRLKIVESNFDLILTNPPYLKTGDEVDRSASFSPAKSLYLDNYLNWFDNFFQEIYNKLVDNGIFIMEGDERYLFQLEGIAKNHFVDLKIIKDYTGRQRFITGRKNHG